MIENTESRDAFEQTIRVLDRQAAVLSELRQRASIVLSGTGITVSLMGSGALKGSYSHGLALTALLATFLGITSCIAVLWPVSDKGSSAAERRWKVTASRMDIARLRSGKTSTSDLLDELDRARSCNYSTISARSKLFTAAAVLLLVQIMAWAALILAKTW
jgi:hypothetical protein